MYDEALQSLLIRITNKAYLLAEGLDNKIRHFCLQFFCVILQLYFLAIYTGLLTKMHIISPFSRQLAGTVILIAIGFFSIDREQKHVPIRKALFVPLTISGMCMLLVSLIHPIGSGYRFFAIILIVVVPWLSLIWNNRQDYNVLFDCIAYAISWVGIAYMIYCMVGLAQGWIIIDSPRFKGTMSHSGNLSQLYTSVFCAGLYLSIQHYENKKRLIYASAVMGIGIGMLLLGQGRSCILACITCIIAAEIFYIKYVPKDAYTRRRVITALLVLAVFSFSILISSSLNDIPEMINDIKNPNSAEQQDADADNELTAVDRFSIEGQDINTFSSGRIELWTLVARELNLLGNNVEEQSIHDLTQDDWLWYAHNVFLEISYHCGIPIGILFIYVELIVGIITLRYLFNNKNKTRWLIFPIMFSIIYAYESMLDCASLPFMLESGCYYYFCMLPMLDRRM